MPRSWYRADLVGVRNGINTSFTIPGIPADVTATAEIIMDGKEIYTVSIAPTGPLEASVTGAAVVMGLAPQATAQLWCYVIYNDDVEMATAMIVMQEIRKTFYYSVQAYDKSFPSVRLNEIIEKDISVTSWSYSPYGGCGPAEIVLRRPYDDFGETSLDWSIEIMRDVDILGKPGARLPAVLPMQLGTAHYGNRELRWGGFVYEIERVLSDDEQVILRCDGWSRQLRRIFIPERTWSNVDVAQIVRDIIDQYVIPGSRIARSSGLNNVPDTGVIIDSITFDTYAIDAINTLAVIAGNCEWGCTANKEFFFIQPTVAVKQTYAIGDRILDYRPKTNADEIVSKVYLRGANGFKRTITFGTPESGYYKERREFVSAIQSTAVADLWGTAYGANNATSTPSGQMSLGETDDWIENVGHPLGLLRVIGGPIMSTTGDRLPALLPFKLGAIYGRNTDEQFKIGSISYQPTEDALQVSIGLGKRKYAFADLLGTLEYKLSELQQAQGL